MTRTMITHHRPWKTVNLPHLVCGTCGYMWTPRKTRVYVCPRCHAPLQERVA